MSVYSSLTGRPGSARPLWIAMGGIAVAAAGTAYDQTWHRRYPAAVSGVAEVLQAHWMILVGIVTVAVALFAGVRTVRHSRSAAVAVRVALLGAAAMLTGFAMDTVDHARGLESPFGHMLISLGFLIVIVTLPAALVFVGLRGTTERRRSCRSLAE